MIATGIVWGWKKICFNLLRPSVTSAAALYSPPFSVDGTAICRTAGKRKGE